MGLLDPRGPWVWLLYALAGAGVVTGVLPSIINQMSQVNRDAYRAHPPVQAFIWLLGWAFWPLLAGFILLGLAETGFWIVWDWIVERVGGRK